MSYVDFSPIEVAGVFDVSNRTIINWCAELCENGYLKPNIVNKRIRTYSLLKEKCSNTHVCAPPT